MCVCVCAALSQKQKRNNTNNYHTLSFLSADLLYAGIRSLVFVITNLLLWLLLFYRSDGGCSLFHNVCSVQRLNAQWEITFVLEALGSLSSSSFFLFSFLFVVLFVFCDAQRSQALTDKYLNRPVRVAGHDSDEILKQKPKRKSRSYCLWIGGWPSSTYYSRSTIMFVCELNFSLIFPLGPRIERKKKTIPDFRLTFSDCVALAISLFSHHWIRLDVLVDLRSQILVEIDSEIIFNYFFFVSSLSPAFRPLISIVVLFDGFLSTVFCCCSLLNIIYLFFFFASSSACVFLALDTTAIFERLK